MFYPVYNKPETTANYYDIVTFSSIFKRQNVANGSYQLTQWLLTNLQLLSQPAIFQRDDPFFFKIFFCSNKIVEI